MRVGIVGLVGHPGRTRPLVQDAAVEAFGDDPWGPLEGAIVGPIGLDLHLDAVVEGILVRGRVTARLVLECARCLTPTEVERDVEVTELFTDPARLEEGEEPDEGYELVDGATALDLTALVRDALLVDLPVRVLCRPDCAGICPVCGAERADGGCGHEEAPEADPRWAALAGLALPPAPTAPDAAPAASEDGPVASDDGTSPAAPGPAAPLAPPDA